MFVFVDMNGDWVWKRQVRSRLGWACCQEFGMLAYEGVVNLLCKPGERSARGGRAVEGVLGVWRPTTRSVVGIMNGFFWYGGIPEVLSLRLYHSVGKLGSM